MVTCFKPRTFSRRGHQNARYTPIVPVFENVPVVVGMVVVAGRGSSCTFRLFRPSISPFVDHFDSILPSDPLLLPKGGWIHGCCPRSSSSVWKWGACDVWKGGRSNMVNAGRLEKNNQYWLVPDKVKTYLEYGMDTLLAFNEQVQLAGCYSSSTVLSVL